MRRLPAHPFGLPMTLGAWLRFDAIRRAIAVAEPRSIIEIGAGVGAMSSRLTTVASYVGVEPDSTSYAVASRRLGDRVRLGDFSVLTGRCADMVCAFEVLEHIEDEYTALVNWTSLLEPMGWMLISVPADPALFGAADEAVGHCRRYTREGLEAVLVKAGYDLVTTEVTGAGIRRVLKWLQDRYIRPPSPSTQDRISASGRQHQPKSGGLGPAFYAAALPGRAMQYPLRHRDTGLGLVALARRGHA